jgi:prepilin-type N-terminal cleavage/methylation domain-containing protein
MFRPPAYERLHPDDAMNAVARRGFTLIELLITVVVIGILAGIAVPKFNGSRRKAYIAAMQSDLRNLVSAEEVFYSDSSRYTSHIASLNVRPSPDVSVQILTGPGYWSASATHAQISDGFRCGIAVNVENSVAPGTSDGLPGCARSTPGATGK